MNKRLILIGVFCTVAQAQELPLDGSQSSVLSFNPANDPLGDIDNYNLLAMSEVEGEWSKDDGQNETEKMKEIMTFNSILHIDVKLVGFDGDGNFGIRVSEAQLLRYFETVLEEHEKDAMVINTRTGQSHHLPFRRKFFFRVMKARKGLSDEISTRIRSWLLTTSGVESSPEQRKNALRDGVAVPLNMVDDLIRKDYQESELTGTHTIYILSPRRVVLPDANRTAPQHRPVFKEGERRAAPPPAAEDDDVLAYWYTPPPEKDTGAGGSAGSGCGTTMWSGYDDRYMWVDLTAGPLSYGPRTSGDGLVSAFTLPHLNNFVVEDLAAAAAARARALEGGAAARDANSHHYAFMESFLAEVASLVGRTCDLLVDPSLHRFPVPLAKALRIHLVVLSDAPPAGGGGGKAQEGFAEGAEAWGLLRRELGARGERLAVQGQTITLTRKLVRLHGCRLCLAALAAARKSHTSTVLRGELKTQVHEYIDSAELHDQLASLLSRRELGLGAELGLPGTWTAMREEEEATVDYRDEWTLPIVLLDLQETQLVLLDRFHQAVSFPDMVIGLQSRAGEATVDYGCADQAAALDPRDPSRALLAALLQTGWGVAATHEHYSGKANRTETDFLWSTAATLFGPLSRSRRLAWPARDAARRNLVAAAAAAASGRAGDVLGRFGRMGLRVEEALLPGEHAHFVRRWNLLRFKMQRSAMYLSLLNFDAALFYARSLRHDAKALRSLVLRAGKFVHSYLACVNDEQPSSLNFLVYLLSGASLSIMAYVALHALLARRASKASFKKAL